MALAGITSSMKIRDPVIRNSLLRFLGRRDAPYKAVAGALENLGLQTHPNDIKFLISFAKDVSKVGRHAIIRNGALRGIANHGSFEGYKYLETQVRVSFFRTLLLQEEKMLKPEPERALVTLIGSLVASSQYQFEKQIRNHVVGLLNDLLIDSRCFIRKEAIFGLIELEAIEKFEAIYSLQSSFACQDWVFIDKKLKNSKEHVGEGQKNLVKSLEEVEGRLRKMEFEVLEKDSNKNVVVESPVVAKFPDHDVDSADVGENRK